ncbi:DMT family transporter [Limibacter armeniacum]|uniref:DMT family transporter n=1 Tax=Limibacter armeniacum TaxID=466084 RepID=UPI002FE6B4B0
MDKNIKAHLALLGAAVIYGANYNIAKGVMPEYILPFGFIVIRVIGGALLFWLLHSLTVKEKVVRWQDYLHLAACAGFGVATNQMLFFKGLSMTSPINASVIMTSTPIIVLLVSSVLIRERITIKKFIGIGLGLIGALWLIGGEGLTFNSETVIGDLTVFANAAAYSIYLVIVKPLMARYHPYTITKWIFLFGTVYVLPFGLGEFQQIEWSTMPTLIIMGVLYVVIGTTFLAYLLNAVALKHVQPSIVSFYIYFQPLIATLIAIIIGSEVLSLQKVLSAILVFIGVFLVSKK